MARTSRLLSSLVGIVWSPVITPRGSQAWVNVDETCAWNETGLEMAPSSNVTWITAVFDETSASAMALQIMAQEMPARGKESE
eukprot:CAMPEP_0172463976 /NCGR_PEP_ID=MMETSP1065-20121228/48935_1 /TAXON_ID=265537 /ORGANISM="Amphiprora paludosa, Strain CCMP125" /LENGTH=82 /DNA_ID=CAMNT_0013220071 /DNA_START=229 /DNA_END=477 /DNA_ORIENTATION=+